MIKVGRTSEAVALGHPDIVMDTIADSIVDLALEQSNGAARCGIEGITAKDEVIVRGEVGGTELKTEDIVSKIREVVNNIGYVDIPGFSYNTLMINIFINQQSADIAQGVVDNYENANKAVGYGDNGIYFGYYTEETELGLPLQFMICKELMAIHSFMNNEERRNIWGIRPDAKCQFTYNGTADNNTLVFCVSHDEGADVKAYVDHVVELFVEKYPFAADILWEAEHFINPTGKFVICGPAGDCGTVGRKLTATTYGGVVPIGGGSLCGKCPTKSDRSLQLMCRKLARDVAAEFDLHDVRVDLSTGIGLSEPTSVQVVSQGLSDTGAEQASKWIIQNYDLTPEGVISFLNLKHIKYAPTAMNGHFGVSKFMPESLASTTFTWEK